MFEAQVQEVNQKLEAAIELAKQDLAAGINSVDEITRDLDQIVPMESNEYYECKCNLNEVASDFRLMAQKFSECEANLKEMLKAAMELYKRDEEVYDIRVSTAYFKLGALGRITLLIVDSNVHSHAAILSLRFHHYHIEHNQYSKLWHLYCFYTYHLPCHSH